MYVYTFVASLSGLKTPREVKGTSKKKMADMTMLYESAVLADKIKAMYSRVKTFKNCKYFTYVLLLQQGKIYVGNTDNVFTRLTDHFRCTEQSSKWVREWGPPVRVVEIVRDSDPETEKYKFSEYADKFGWENVRGAGCCRVLMRNEPHMVRNFTRKQDNEYEYLTREEINDIVTKIETL